MILFGSCLKVALSRFIQLMPDKITPKFHPLCNQKLRRASHDVFLALLKFLVAERMKFWSSFIWHQLKRDKATFNSKMGTF